jgi:hypothetical protein
MGIRDFVKLKTGIDLAGEIVGIPKVRDLVRLICILGVPLLATGVVTLVFHRYYFTD